MPFDPFGILGSAVAKVATDSLTAAMLALWNAGLWVLRVVLELEDAILTPNLGDGGPIAELYATTFWIALALVGILVLVQIGVALGKRDGRSLGRLLVGAAQFGFVWFTWVGYGVTLVAACSGLTKALMLSLLNVTRWSEWKPWEPFTANDVTNGTVAVILGIMGLMLWLAAIGHTLVMLARAASLIVLAAVTPISAAGLVTDFGRDWFWKSFRWFHAAALTPPLMVLALGVGVKINTGVAIGGESDVLRSIGTAFVGVVLICVSAFSPLALYKLFAFTDPGSTSGASMRAGLAAAGGIGGVLAGRQTAGSSAATTTDDAGRTAGEDGAAATTIGRFAATMGPVGQALSAGIGVMAGIGGAAAAMGTNAANQMGVGHNNFPPDYSRRGVRAANGQPGNGGPDAAPDNPAPPDDPTVGNSTNGLDGSGWGGPQPDAAATSALPGGGGAAPTNDAAALGGSRGGVAAHGAASSAELTEVARAAAL
jgi:hypothetical protein